MVKKILKIIGISIGIGLVALVILSKIGNLFFIDSKIKSEADEKMYQAVAQINANCPIQVGAYDYLTNVSFSCDTICYDYELKYDAEIEKYCSENSEVMKKLTLFLFVVNEHYGWNSEWAELINKYDYVWKQRTKIGNVNFLTIEFNGKELKSALKDITSDEALQSFLDATLFLVNHETPLLSDEDGNEISDISVTKDNYGELSKKYLILKKVLLENRDIIYEFSLPEVIYPTAIKKLKEINNTPDGTELLLEDMCTDPDFKDSLKIFAIAKCNLIFRYYGVKSKETIDVKIPYSLIRKNTYIPPEFLELN